MRYTGNPNKKSNLTSLVANTISDVYNNTVGNHLRQLKSIILNQLGKAT